MKLDLAVIGQGAVSPGGVGTVALRNAPQAAEIPFLGGDGKKQAVFKVDLRDPSLARWQKEARLRRASPISLFLIEAAEQALGGLTTEERKRTGLVVAFSTGSLVYSRRFFEAIVRNGRKAASPALFPETVFNSPVSHVAATLGLGGLAYALVGDETAWIAALKTAWLWLRQGEADQVLVLGAEEFDEVILDTYRAAGWLGKTDRLIPSEGAGAVLVRSARPDDHTILTAAEDGFIYRNRLQAVAAAWEALAGHADGTRVVRTAGQRWLRSVEADATARFQAIEAKPPYLGEAFTASAAWQTLRTLSLLEQNSSPLLLPIWGLNHQIGWIEAKKR